MNSPQVILGKTSPMALLMIDDTAPDYGSKGPRLAPGEGIENITLDDKVRSG